MKEALKEAKKAYEKGEVPIGAVIVKDNQIISRAHNLVEMEQDPTAHAEIIAIRQAARKIGRLTECDMYVTCEPCSMCSGAIVWAKIKNLYIGTKDEKTGCCGSIFNIVQEDKLNHRVNVCFDVLQKECSEILKDFFKQLRKRGNRYK